MEITHKETRVIHTQTTERKDKSRAHTDKREERQGTYKKKEKGEGEEST